MLRRSWKHQLGIEIEMIIQQIMIGQKLQIKRNVDAILDEKRVENNS